MPANGRFKYRHRPQRFRLLRYFVLELLCSLHFTAIKIDENPKTIINNDFLNPNQFSTFSGNSPPQFLILKDFYHKTLINMIKSLNKITDFLVMMNLK